MDLDFFILNIAVFGATALQSATGIGFGIIAGLAVAFTLFLILRNNRVPSHSPQLATKSTEQISIGALSGIMGASLAMPGPIPAAWMSTRGFSKETIRATILVMFVFAYVVALALQFGLAGIGADAMQLSAMLAPSTIIGILVGRSLASRVTERTFHYLLVIILASTAIILFSTLIGL